jgi:hypothetical protein
MYINYFQNKNENKNCNPKNCNPKNCNLKKMSLGLGCRMGQLGTPWLGCWLEGGWAGELVWVVGLGGWLGWGKRLAE